MDLSSVYLNPFQPFPERSADEGDDGHVGTAIEDNLSRAVFSALANADSPRALAKFLRTLGRHASAALRIKVDRIADVLRKSDAREVEFGLQTWPNRAIKEGPGLLVILVGISSSHEREWTHDHRCAPESPRPDAWAYVPGKLLVVFECKNDAFPLDATQISAYVHALGLIAKGVDVPRAEPGKWLASAAHGKAVREACMDIVLDVPWATVADGLRTARDAPETGEIGRWLCGRAAEYIQWHVRPPYRGVATILEWLKGPDTPDRCGHLRTLIRKMGDQLAKSASDQAGTITFGLDELQKGDLARGAGSAVYVKLRRNGESLQRDWLGAKVNAVLWFDFTEEDQRIGLEFYVQAPGSHTSGRGDPLTAWNQASDRHLACAAHFEASVAAWVPIAPPNSRVIVSAVRFKGSKTNWQGGGVDDFESQNTIRTSPEGALGFLRAHREELWRFPKVGVAEHCRSVQEAAKLVRKPAISLIAPLNVSALAECGEDGNALQDVLQAAVNGL